MQDFLKIFLVLLVAGVLYYLVFSYYKKKNDMERYVNHASYNANKKEGFQNQNRERFANKKKPRQTRQRKQPKRQEKFTNKKAKFTNKKESFTAHDPVGAGDHHLVNEHSNAPKDCFPKDQLAPSELLPSNAQNKWADVNPNGQGKLGDQNFLSAGYHFGTDTVGQSLRNANRQLRSEPANPQVKVSPWMQTTIEPDINRKPLEIGGC